MNGPLTVHPKNTCCSCMFVFLLGNTGASTYFTAWFYHIFFLLIGLTEGLTLRMNSVASAFFANSLAQKSKQRLLESNGPVVAPCSDNTSHVRCITIRSLLGAEKVGDGFVKVGGISRKTFSVIGRVLNMVAVPDEGLSNTVAAVISDMTGQFTVRFTKKLHSTHHVLLQKLTVGDFIFAGGNVAFTAEGCVTMYCTVVRSVDDSDEQTFHFLSCIDASLREKKLCHSLETGAAVAVDDCLPAGDASKRLVDQVPTLQHRHPNKSPSPPTRSIGAPTVEFAIRSVLQLHGNGTIGLDPVTLVAHCRRMFPLFTDEEVFKELSYLLDCAEICVFHNGNITL